jgi:UDP-N-acetyl-D-mannosaminuronate dehydrogenase
MAKEHVVVIGLGEVGRPLFELMAERHKTIGVDIKPVRPIVDCGVLHICYPFGKKFVESVVDYIKDYRPALTVINSTVAPGTTRAIHAEAQTPIAYSPIRGKHFKMKQDLLHYVKFIGGINTEAARLAENHFHSIGFKTKIVRCPEAAELAKLSETTYFGLLIAWAQEVARYCDRFDASYDDVASFFDEIAFLPRVRYTPGIIGGHCVMPNIEILKQTFDSELLDAIVNSNEMRKQQPERATGETNRCAFVS